MFSNFLRVFGICNIQCVGMFYSTDAKEMSSVSVYVRV